MKVAILFEVAVGAGSFAGITMLRFQIDTQSWLVFVFEVPCS